MRKLLSILMLLPVGIISSSLHAQNELVLEEVVVTATKKEENHQQKTCIYNLYIIQCSDIIEYVLEYI